MIKPTWDAYPDFIFIVIRKIFSNNIPVSVPNNAISRLLVRLQTKTIYFKTFFFGLVSLLFIRMLMQPNSDG